MIHKVKGCGDCDWRHDGSEVCLHPDSIKHSGKWGRDLMEEDTNNPYWCPLRNGPTTIELEEE